MTVTIEIFSQGEEIITGQTVDSNSAWLSEQVVALGFKVTRHSTVGDDLNDLTTLLNEIAQRADCCLCTGGLGPTSDDLTAEAVAKAFALPLTFDAVAYAQIAVFFEQRNRPMPASNRKQAMLPQGALRIDNTLGTAPGFAVKHGRCWFAFMPGVPAEMRHLFKATIKAYLQQHFKVQPSHLVTLKTVGIGESALQERIKDIPLPPSVQLGFRAGTEDVQTKLLFPFAYPSDDKQRLVTQFVAQIGDFVFAIDGLEQPASNLVAVIAAELNATRQTVAVIETLSQGLIAAKCIGQPWLIQSLYQPTLERLTAQFGLALNQMDLMDTALRLGQLVRQQSGADFALVQLLDSSASNAQDEPMVLYTVLATAHGAYPQTLTVSGKLQRKQNQAALMALDLLRRFLQGKHTIVCHEYA
ncbi:MAG: competence/damage-inducible protein A [Methylococcaceae bacterium]|nr:competence/damage-inducible protein A [Methylococcaceae bacterium]